MFSVDVDMCRTGTTEQRTDPCQHQTVHSRLQAMSDLEEGKKVKTVLYDSCRAILLYLNEDFAA